jgi:xanthine dehydrogenase YagR molybdenum-binding subunit
MTTTTIGRTGLSRKDGRPKVCGEADYTADHRPENLLYAVYATSRVAHGRIVALDVETATQAPGVVAVLTHENLPTLPPLTGPVGQTFLPLQDDRVLYEGQPIALVLADTLERATYAASLVTAQIEPAPYNVDLLEGFDERRVVENGYDEPDTRVGDVDAGLRAADARVEERYTIAHRHHTAMEPSATVASWDGDELTTWDATQHIWGVQHVLAAAFRIPSAKVRVISHYLGGGFGSKGYVWPHQILAPLAARVTGRPVKLVLTRAQAFTAHGYQSATIHDVKVGARRDGTLTAISHDVVYTNASADDFPEYAAAGTRSMYACPAIATTHRAVKLHLPQPTAMRAPNEGMGNFALESAIDELAERLGIDPLELRLRNEAERDPTSGLPFSSKKLREAYALGAERFGWPARAPRPRAMRDGEDLVGFGMASCLMTTYRMGSGAAVAMRADGSAVVRAGAQEIGTGIYTIMPQIAAEVLEIDPDRVTMELGDTRLPEAGPTYGSSSTMGVGSAVADAAAKLRAKLRELGAVAPGGYAEAAARAGGEVSADGTFEPRGGETYAMFGFGAVFVEVRVDASLGTVRVRRTVGAYSAGRIVNPKTATSQMTGGMIWGIGQALLERSEVDARLGRFVSKNLAGYLVPANLDVGHLEAHFVEEYDRHASAIGARGIGELGATGVAAAIANAVYHATGIRVRDLPIGPERLLDAR